MTRPRLAAAAVVLFGLVVTTLAVASGGSRPFSVTTDVPSLSDRSTPVVTPSASAPSGRSGGSSGNVVLDIMSLLLIAAAVVSVAVVVYLLVARTAAAARLGLAGAHTRPAGSPPVAPTAELAAVVDQGILDLTRGPVSDGIVTCWLGVEAAAVRAGVRLRPEETSAEFTDRVIASYDVPPKAMRELARLYREARFSDHPLPESARARAAECLRAVQDEIHARP